MNRISCARTLLILLIACCHPAFAQEAHREIIRAKLQSDLQSVVLHYEGVAGLHIVDLTSGDRWAIRDELQLPQASAIKVPIHL